MSGIFSLKHSVELAALSPQMVLAAQVVNSIAQNYVIDGEVTITSGSDSHHSSKSLHYRGDALDFRTRNMRPEMRERFYKDVRDALPRDFDVLLEGDHLHVEYDVRRPRALDPLPLAEWT